VALANTFPHAPGLFRIVRPGRTRNSRDSGFDAAAWTLRFQDRRRDRPMLNEELLHHSASEVQREAAADEQLERAVVVALNRNAQVPPNCVTALAHHGVVTLQGTVDWKYQSVAAVSAATEVPGVGIVDNQIVVEIS
jgi:hypothetical protein